VTDAGALRSVHLFPVRHHSPRSSAVLAAFLAAVRPEAVLVEAPEDAEKLAAALVDPETRPPVAILGYRTDGVQASALWPFAAYSPEYVATKWAAENGARVVFIDIPITRSLGTRAAEEEEEAPSSSQGGDIEEEEVAPDAEPEPPGRGGRPVDVHEACARARGFRTFEEFWEASFEAPSYDAASFRAALLGYADLVRASDRSVMHRARDAYMAEKILAEIRRGTDPSAIVVVVGAAHAAALSAGDVDPGLTELLPEPVQAEATLIPFSFPRLAEQLGYGAGNRAPQYYQRAHDAGCSFTRATLEVLVEFTEHLRLRGFMASLGDTIEAYRLAVTLAGLRGKAEPGLDEVREATIATLCRGDATHVDSFLWPSVIGRHVGKVAGKIGKNSLQEEFWREVDDRRLPRTDALTQFTLKLNDPVQVETSVLLHRLRVAGVPYAAYIGRQRGSRRARKRGAPAEEAGELDALTRVSEAWEAQWTPSTDIALIERIVFGNTLEEVTARVLEDRLESAKSAREAASVLHEAVVTGAPRAVESALAACDRVAATDDDLPSLAGAAAVLSVLVSYGSSRRSAASGDEALPPLCRKTFDRAVLRVRDACAGDDDAVVEPRRALRTLHEVAQIQPIVDRDAWIAAARALVDSYAVNPGASGVAAGLLHLAQILSDDDLTLIVGQRISDALEPERAASFLAGFLEVNATVLRNRPVVAALDAFLSAIDPARLRDALPVLRRAFATLGATERRYLLENVLAVRKIGDKASAAQAVLLEKDKEKLAAMATDLARAMDDLDDLL